MRQLVLKRTFVDSETDQKQIRSEKRMDAYFMYNPMSRKIDDATSQKDEVPPVYLMDEIAELSKSSTVATNEDIAERLSKRLTNKSPIVAWKVVAIQD